MNFVPKEALFQEWVSEQLVLNKICVLVSNREYIVQPGRGFLCNNQPSGRTYQLRPKHTH